MDAKELDRVANELRSLGIKDEGADLWTVRVLLTKFGLPHVAANLDYARRELKAGAKLSAGRVIGACRENWAQYDAAKAARTAAETAQRRELARAKETEARRAQSQREQQDAADTALVRKWIGAGPAVNPDQARFIESVIGALAPRARNAVRDRVKSVRGIHAQAWSAARNPLVIPALAAALREASAPGVRVTDQEESP